MTHICGIIGCWVPLRCWDIIPSCPALFARQGHFKFNSPAERSENAALN